MLSAVPFDQLPDDARVWVFASPLPLATEQADTLLGEVDRFIAGWLAHGHPVVGARDLRYDRFLLIGADERATGVSGCSIDSLFRTLQRLEREAGITLLDSSRVWYRGAEGGIETVDRPEFRARARAGEVSPDTVVFDNTVSDAGQVRNGAWETPARESWHARLFR
jgi:hypothetical protein